jgi:hypothetical protein
MPNNDTVFSPSNCWAFIELGTCTKCTKPRHLYANSMVRNFFGCVWCVTKTMNEALSPLYDLAQIDEGVKDTYDKFRAEYVDLCDKRNYIGEPEYSEDTCALCYHPFGENQWRKVEALDGEGNLLQVHNTCGTTCDKCSLHYASWSSVAHGRVTFVDFNKYLGDHCCPSCVTELRKEYGEDSFFYCDECNSYELYDDSRSFEGSRYCNSCYDNNVYQCNECDTYYWDGNDHDCEEDISSQLIHEYSYRPRPHFFGQAKYYLGFELEVESNGNSRKVGASYVVDRLSPRVYLKNDGSLDEGFEIVSHPHTLDELHEKFDWTVLKGLRQQGFRSWDTRTCGLHVHVSRTAFGEVSKRSDINKTQAHELRFIKLIYDNQRQIERLAGRSSDYAKFNDKGSLANRVKYGTQDDRYEAVNSQNEKTLEVRVFKGSLKPARVLSAVELVHASVEYTRDLKVNASNNALKWIHFVRFVADQAETYPNLVNAIQSTFDNDTPAQEID